MNNDIKKKWVAALRSGEYKQGQGQLRSNTNAFCCLGVLCNLHAQAHPEIAAEQKSKTLYLRSNSYPAQQVWTWAGLPTNSPTVQEGQRRFSLASLNDDGATFAHIADLIEAQL